MKKRNFFMAATLMCGFSLLAFTFDDNGIYWFWEQARPIAVILGLATLVLAVFWYKAEKHSETAQK